jgi:hypothetical protein
MIAFEIDVNGEKVGVIGIDGGIFSIMLSYVDDGRGLADLNATGTHELVPGNEQYLQWPIPSHLRIGDAMSIRVIETDRPTASEKIEIIS